jgi:hypothetical protein
MTLNLRSQRGGALLVVAVIVVILLFLVIGIWAAYRFQQLQQKISGMGNTTHTVYSGSLTAPRPFPTAVQKKPVTLTYTVTQANGNQNNIGPVLIAGPQTPAAGVNVTFTLSAANATVNGAATVTVATDAKGLAQVTLAPTGSGTNTLQMSIQVGKDSAADSEVFQFEVQK